MTIVVPFLIIRDIELPSNKDISIITDYNHKFGFSVVMGNAGLEQRAKLVKLFQAGKKTAASKMKGFEEPLALFIKYVM